MSTQAEKFKEIADAIRARTETTKKIVASDFATEITFMDTARKTTLYPEGIDNGYCGNLAAQVAASYHYVRKMGKDEFNYVQYNNNVFNVRGINGNDNDLTAQVRDHNGRGLIDCSSYIGLVLRGIDYNNSPFAKYGGVGQGEIHWKPSDEFDKTGKTGLKDMYGKGNWIFKILDQQPPGVWRNFGFVKEEVDGKKVYYSTPRGAGSIGEFFYKYGQVIYERALDGTGGLAQNLNSNDKVDKLNDIGKEVLKSLRPGDLIFMSKYGEDWNKEGKRFHSISHIAMVAEDPTKYFHVLGNDTSKAETEESDSYLKEDTILYYDFAQKSSQISLICRPNYLHGGLLSEVPIGVNILTYPWTFNFDPDSTNSEKSVTEKTSSGITVALTSNIGELKISGTKSSNSSSATIALKGEKYDKDKSGSELNYIRLSPGTYKLSGTEGTGIEDTLKLNLRTVGDESNSATTLTSCYGNQPGECTIEKETKAYIRLSITETSELNCTITPTLERIS